MSELAIERLIQAFFFGVGAVVAITCVNWIRGLLNAKQKASILEINLESKSIADAVGKLVDDELIKRANERLETLGDDPPKE